VFIVDSQVHIWREETLDRPWVILAVELTEIAAGLGVNVPAPIG
jgi:hypothetical protein